MTSFLVTGATGTIGVAVCAALLERGDQVVALSRDSAHASSKLPSGTECVSWSHPTTQPPPVEALRGADAVIHLLGEPVAQRWTADAKARIRDSRVLSTRMLVSALTELTAYERPGVLVSQSATGFYGPSDSRELDEQAPAGTDFLSEVVQAWEAEALAATDLTRVALTRTGVVLSPSGGALAKMLPFFKLGIGGPVAGGHQYVPWIHLDDVVAGLIFCADTAGASGPVNLTAPQAVDNAELSRALGSALHRPALLPVPGLAIHLLYGEMAEIVTTGQRVAPRRLLDLGFEFKYSRVGPALRAVMED